MGRAETADRHDKPPAHKESMESHVSNQVHDIRRTEGSPPSIKADSVRQSEDLQKKGVLPDLQLVGDAQKTLGDSKATAADKLSSVENLSKHGIKNIQVADADGKMRDYSIETSKVGNRDAVHLYGKDDKGQNRVALRGIDNGNGTFSSEKDKHGNEVGFQGSKWGANGTDKSNIASVSDGQNLPAKDNSGADVTLGKTRGLGEKKGPEQGAPSADQQTPDKSKQPTDTSGAPKQAQPDDAGAGKQLTNSGTSGGVNRSQFDKELSDPKVKEAFARRIESEVGSQGQEARVAFAEEVMNRAASRDTSLMKAINDKGYYPGGAPRLGKDANVSADNAAIQKAWKGSSDKPDTASSYGSDTTHGATGNASKHVNFGAGGHKLANGEWVSNNQTAKFGGERFGIEEKDKVEKNWMERYANLQQIEVASK